MGYIIGVDIGGTFTDFILYDSDSGAVKVHKVASSAEPSESLVAGVLELCDRTGIRPADIDSLMHGTTVATNAILEHDGARTALITTKGFRDVLHIGRHQRPQHYSIMQDIPWQSRPLARRRHRKVVTERVNAPGGEIEIPLDEDELRAVIAELRADDVEAVAVGFVNSYLNPAHERRALEILAEELPGVFVTASSELFPQFREFERFTTTAINAFVGPKVAEYLRRLEFALDRHGIDNKLHIMMSNGGVATVTAAARTPATLLMSGPAAGVLGGTWVGRRAGRQRLITFDMGGTSADIGIATERGTVEAPARDTAVGGYPLLVPMLDLHTIGAGGGSVAYVDEGGAFHVGPRSAGSVPGPACYGRGGTEPTVTDAHVVLGRIDPDRFLAGEMRLDGENARTAIEGLGRELGLSATEAAEGVITVANNNMAGAVRERTVQRGLDPRDFALVAFGGAGPLHAAEIAELLDIPEVLVPPYPGITSAMGLLTTDLRYDLMRTVFMLHTEFDHARVNADFAEHEAWLRRRLAEDGVADADIAVGRALDCRYVGQGYELRVDIPTETLDDGVLTEAVKGFHAIHEREYGHCFPGEAVEIVNLRSTATGKAPRMHRLPPPASSGASEALLGSGYGLFRVDGRLREMPVLYIDRWKLPADEPVTGPAVIFQRDTTTLVPPGWQARHGDEGTLFLTRRSPR
ncbi:hydantoinase/oxoprolinase family protein [Pseudonocardia acaciae]|uniref:hydantoinase/oxoprolinase family protein n=1 Tax=Pseudonocardia acaciae TaxID=551276 RepID=UPI000A86AAB2|nr:hydantoinase/oxoprolinase family protein [Pseudonocardia acaciae]